MDLWTFDRADRLGQLADRASRMMAYLGRELADAPHHSEARARYWARLDVVERRMQRLRLVARAARHNRRYDLARAEAAIGAGS